MTQLGGELLKPASQYYTTPGGATEAAKVHATKEASYLSSMDQFYAQLDESMRQFDLGFGLDEKRFGLEEERFGLEEEKFDFTKETTEETSELDWFKAQTDRIGTIDRGEYYGSVSAQGWGELDYKYDKLEQDEFNPDDYQKMVDIYKQSQSGGKIKFRGNPNAQSTGLYSDYYDNQGNPSFGLT